MADPNKEGWITAPLDYNEWAENFSALVKYLIEDKKYTCINEITPMNEPDGGCFSEPSEYIKMARILDARFKKDNIRSKVRFDLSDNTDSRVFYLTDCAKHLSDVADVFNSHTYIFGYNVPNDSIFNWEKNNMEIAKIAGKKHLVGEFGSNQCVGATRQKDIDFYVRGVLITRLALNFLNAGAAGVSYWSLIDQYYGRNESYSNMQQLGLWKYVKEAYSSDAGVYDKIKEDYEVRPQYYAYSLLTKYVRPGSDIYPIDLGDDYAIGSAFEDENGKWTYVFANAGEAQKTLLIGNPEANGSFSIYEYSEDTLPEGDNLIEPKETKKTENGKLEVIVNPNTVLLCHQK